MWAATRLCPAASLAADAAGSRIRPGTDSPTRRRRGDAPTTPGTGPGSPRTPATALSNAAVGAKCRAFLVVRVGSRARSRSSIRSRGARLDQHGPPGPWRTCALGSLNRDRLELLTGHPFQVEGCKQSPRMLLAEWTYSECALFLQRVFASQLLATERVSHRGGCSERQAWVYASSGRALFVEMRLARRRGRAAGPRARRHIRRRSSSPSTLPVCGSAARCMREYSGSRLL